LLRQEGVVESVEAEEEVCLVVMVPMNTILDMRE